MPQQFDEVSSHMEIYLITTNIAVNNWITDLFVPLFFDKEFYFVMVKQLQFFGDEISV